MKFSEYIKKAINTKIYADEVGRPYCVLGLVEEFGEFITAVHRDSVGSRTDENKELFLKELGDCFWFLAGAFDEYGMTSVLKENKELDNIEDYELEVGKPIDLYFVEISELAGITAKIMRDGYDAYKSKDYSSKDKKGRVWNDRIQESLIKALKALVLMSKQYGLYYCERPVTITEILEMNIKKLSGRKKKGTISGDGDLR